MKKNYNYIFLLITAVLIGLQANSQVVYDFTGSEETYVVPPGITLIHIEAKGAKGMDGSSGGAGGNGAIMSGTFTVTPGEELTVYAGGTTGGIQRGGDGSYVGNEDGEPLIVAGGGGGGGNAEYGGGAPITEDGTAPPVHTGGDGGTDGEGGIAGTGEWGTGGGGGWYSAGTDGEFPGGTTGGAAPCRGSVGTTFAGGAGGGYSGGGGVEMYGGAGIGGGGAGGSYNAGTDQDNSAAAHTGLGQVTITVLCSGLIIEVSDYDLCEGEELLVHGESLTGGTVMWDGGLENDVPYLLDGEGTYEFTATSTSGSDCSFTFEVEVHGSPDIEANADPEVVCYGQELILSGSGGAFYEWGPGDIEDDEPFVPELGTHTYTVTGEDWYGCFNTDEITVTVIESPEVTASASDESICLGESVTLSGSGAATYEWDMDVEDGVAFIPEETGTYTYNVMGWDDEGECFGEATVDIMVNELPVIDEVTTTEEIFGDDGSISITVSGGMPTYTFDWDNDGTGDFDDDEDLTGIAGGTYSVVVKDANGCEVMSDEYTVNSQVGIEDQSILEKISLYPNPTKSITNLKLKGNFEYALIAINGEEIFRGTAVDNVQFTTNHLANGVYFVSVKNEQGSAMLKLVKQ